MSRANVAATSIRSASLPDERELFRMRIENLNWENCVIFVPDSKTPEGRRLVPMSRRVFEILRKRCGTRNDGWVFPSKRSASGHLRSICNLFREARNEAGTCHHHQRDGTSSSRARVLEVTPPVRIPTYRVVGCFHQQEAQQQVVLFTDVPQALMTGAGVLAGNEAYWAKSGVSNCQKTSDPALYINSSMKARVTSSGIRVAACVSGPASSTGSAP
jgi:hypothetical protein